LSNFEEEIKYAIRIRFPHHALSPALARFAALGGFIPMGGAWMLLGCCLFICSSFGSSTSEEPQHPSATSPALSLTPQEQQFLQTFLRQHQANHGTAMPAAPAPPVVGGGDASWQPAWQPSLPALPPLLGDASPPRGRAEHAPLPSLRPGKRSAVREAQGRERKFYTLFLFFYFVYGLSPFQRSFFFLWVIGPSFSQSTTNV